MLADNIVLIKKRYPEIYKAVKNCEEKSFKASFIVEKAADGNQTLKYFASDRALFVHSKYDPLREATSIIDKFIADEELTSDTHVLFYGLGLGYHIEEFTKRFTDINFSIFEPSIEIVSAYLNHKLFKKLSLKKLVSFHCDNNVVALYNSLIQSEDKKFVICVLPVYPKIFSQEYETFLSDYLQLVKSQRSQLSVNYAFKKRWIINSVNNFRTILTTPNILMDNQGQFKDKTAILVSAGPSLDYEIENLRNIKNNNLAFIFSVGTSINTLIHHGIYPDAMTTYDPTEHNKLVFNNINECGIKSIPMIFGSSVAYEVIEEYKGPKLHTITTQDTVSDYFLKRVVNERIAKVTDASSIAVVTFELLVKLGFKRIILVGQNLSYANRKIYASGVTHRSNEVDTERFELNTVENVNGELVETSEHMLQMKKQLEVLIENSNVEVFNTTVDGANISGTKYVRFFNLIQENLTEKIMDGNEFSIEVQECYNKTYLVQQLQKFILSFQLYQNQLTNLKRILEELKKVTDVKRINSLISQLEVSIKELERNSFFSYIAQPINRVEYAILVNKANGIKNEKNVMIKYKKITQPTEILINHLLQDMELNKSIVCVLENTIEDYAKVC
ncbi:motility associated factor glycosyltransferase family protein [Acetobacterium wieringae]|uniref:motility associated factor glycosyltransferase family protein n=1 Tax=Acetobacterium wieringae TaxID=52694 RepID=UPI0026F2464C|nr:6-hydroxymethylpterin diphosphokinase MptE-like protein [Acetobacterium wieringae]